MYSMYVCETATHFTPKSFHGKLRRSNSSCLFKLYNTHHPIVTFPEVFLVEFLIKLSTSGGPFSRMMEWVEQEGLNLLLVAFASQEEEQQDRLLGLFVVAEPKPSWQHTKGGTCCFQDHAWRESTED
jgi:hypothetical protein